MASNLFSIHGIEKVKISQLTIAFGISEEQFFVNFESKSHLVDECLKQKINAIETKVPKIISCSQSSLESLICVSGLTFKELSFFCPAFYEDLRKYSTIQKRLEIFIQSIKNICNNELQKCREEELIDLNTNNESMIAIYLEEIRSMESKYQWEMMKLFLKGFCTEKGRTELNHIVICLEKFK